MEKEFKDPVRKKTQFNIDIEHCDFFKTFKNASKYMRWMIENNPDYIRHRKELKKI